MAYERKDILPDFPFVKGTTSGYFRVASDVPSIRGRLVQLLLTNPGDRVGLCDFGVGVMQFIFEPLDSISLSNLRARIQSQMSRYEPNLKITNLTTEVTSWMDPTTILITIEVTNLKIPAPATFQVEVGTKKWPQI